MSQIVTKLECPNCGNIIGDKVIGEEGDIYISFGHVDWNTDLMWYCPKCQKIINTVIPPYPIKEYIYTIATDEQADEFIKAHQDDPNWDAATMPYEFGRKNERVTPGIGYN